jgi:formylglycine-generating enzyme required for sulfatase activity
MKFRKIIPWILAAVVAAGSGNAIAASRGLQLEYKASEAVGAPIAGSVRLYDASYALVIGNDAYKAWPRLSNAVKDAELVAAELERQGFEVTLQRNLTSTQLKSVLEDFYIDKGADKNARLMVWYAGHGETVNGEGYLVPVDAPRITSGRAFKRKALSLRRFGEFVRQAEAKHAMAVFDSCFAGTIFGSTRNKPPPAVTRSTGLPVRQFLTSGDAGEAVSDDGTFRKLFIRALRGEERADANGDGYLTGSELGNYLGDRVVNLQIGQTPRYGKLRDPDYDRGDFVFSLGGSTPEPAPVNTVDRDALFWSSIKDSKDAADYQAYLDQFPDGGFSALARNRLKRMAKQVASVVVSPKPKPSPLAKSAVGVFPQRYKTRDTFKDCEECPEMIMIPKGSFRMGDLDGIGNRDEYPVHRVNISYSLAVGKFEVTQSQWRSVMGSDPSNFKGGTRPVERVSWDDAQGYLQRLNANLGLTGRSNRYRLLSEAEWEYVARAGTETRYNTGNTLSMAQAQYGRNNDGRRDAYTVSVGSFPPNAFGLYDTHGNVWEWTEDCWNDTYKGAPDDGSSQKSGDCSSRVRRGGSWNYDVWLVRLASRLRSEVVERTSITGFRVARTLPQ